MSVGHRKYFSYEKGKGNETFLIRVWKLLPSRCVLKNHETDGDT